MDKTTEARNKIEKEIQKEAFELAQHICGFCGEVADKNPDSISKEGSQDQHSGMVFTMAMTILEAAIKSHVIGDQSLQIFSSQMLFKMGAFCLTGEDVNEVTVEKGRIGPDGEIILEKNERVVH